MWPRLSQTRAGQEIDLARVWDRRGHLLNRVAQPPWSPHPQPHFWGPYPNPQPGRGAFLVTASHIYPHILTSSYPPIPHNPFTISI